MTMAVPGHSTKLEFGTESSLTEVEFIEDITPGEIALDDIETSHMQSPDQWKEFMAGWKDAGEITASVQHDGDQYDALLDEVGVKQDWVITLQDGSKIQVEGYLKGLGAPVEREGKTLNSLTIKCSGKPEFTSG